MKDSLQQGLTPLLTDLTFLALNSLQGEFYTMRWWNNLSQKLQPANSLTRFPHKHTFMDLPLYVSILYRWVVCLFV